MKKILLTTSILLSGTLAFGLSLTNESYGIKSKYSENCLKTESSNAEVGSKLIQGSCLENNSRTKFNFSETDSGYYTISNNNGLYLSVAGNSKSNGINIILSSNPSEFKIEEVEGNYKIKDKNSSKYLTIEHTSNDIVQFTKHDSSDQLWRFISATDNDDTDNSETEPINFNGKTYDPIVSPITGRVWLDKNLGAISVCSSSTDSYCYGDYYYYNDTVHDDICPDGYNIPTRNELVAETIDSSIQDVDINNDGNIKVENGATAFKNFLKLPLSGTHLSNDPDNNIDNEIGTVGYLWTTDGVLRFTSYDAKISNADSYSTAYSVRCIKK